jgi:hypothetical protein
MNAKILSCLVMVLLQISTTWAQSSGVAMVKQSIQGKDAIATDIDGDGKFEFYEVPFENGFFVEWKEEGRRFRHYLQKIDEKKFKKVYATLIDGKWIILEEMQLKRIDDHVKVEIQTRVAPGAYKVREFFEKSRQMQAESRMDRIWNDTVEMVTGSPSESRRLAFDRESYLIPLAV